MALFKPPYMPNDFYAQPFADWYQHWPLRHKREFAAKKGLAIDSPDFRREAKSELRRLATASDIYEICYPFVVDHEMYQRALTQWRRAEINREHERLGKVGRIEHDKADVFAAAKCPDDFLEHATKYLDYLQSSSPLAEWLAGKKRLKEVKKIFEKKRVTYRLYAGGKLHPSIDQKEQMFLTLYALIAKCYLYYYCPDHFLSRLESEGIIKPLEIDSTIASHASRLRAALKSSHINHLDLNDYLENLDNQKFPSDYNEDYYESRLLSYDQKKRAITHQCVVASKNEFCFENSKSQSFPPELLKSIIELVSDTDAPDQRSLQRNIKSIESDLKVTTRRF